jgi:glycosyltransferase involved in cell wall biosynthesis
MRILILTQYFPPETGAPQNRLLSLAKNLTSYGETVTILTAMPNYPKMEIFKKYRRKLYLKETIDNITVLRGWIYASSRRNIFTRLLNYFSFVLTSLLVGVLRKGKYDIILCESPPLFLGISALFLRKIKKSKLVFNVSDLWPESVEKLGIIKNKVLLNLAYKLEKKIYSKSVLVSGQTQGIIENIKLRYPNINTFWLPNGIDYEQFNINCKEDKYRNILQLQKDDFIILYAGIFGFAQGLETVIEAANILQDKQHIKFILVGNGPERLSLINLTQKRKIKNIIFIENLPRNEIPEIIAACNAYVVPLKKLDIFNSAIPSKLFEPLAIGKPIILGVDGEARKIFIEKSNCGLYYEPENPVDLARCVMLFAQNEKLAQQLGENGRKYIKSNFDRSKIADEFYKQIIQINKES